VIQNNNDDNTGNKRGRPAGRPKTVIIRQHQIVECVNCFKTFDLNLRSLDQAIISDDKFCFSCFNLIMQQEYHNDEDPLLDREIKELFWSDKIRYSSKI
jgi:hypothetical protein